MTRFLFFGEVESEGVQPVVIRRRTILSGVVEVRTMPSSGGVSVDSLEEVSEKCERILGNEGGRSLELAGVKTSFS